MKKILFFVLLLSLSACHSITPNAGEEAVLIKQPILFGSGGIDGNPIKTGQVWVALTTSYVVVDMKPLIFHVQVKDMMSKDGVPLEFDSSLRLKVNDSVKLVEKFGENWYKNNVEMVFLNLLRQSVRKHGMNETAINTEAIDAIDAECNKGLADYIAKIQLPVDLLGVTVGKANPPDAVKHQRVETATQEQRVLTEQQRKLAEDSRKEAEISRATADNAYRNNIGLNTEQFIMTKQIDMQRAVCEKGNCTFVIGGQTPTPVFKISK